ncbi:hypothetical protein V8C86DRAFT_2534441 [Haematococcus lacustris]
MTQGRGQEAGGPPPTPLQPPPLGGLTLQHESAQPQRMPTPDSSAAGAAPAPQQSGAGREAAVPHPGPVAVPGRKGAAGAAPAVPQQAVAAKAAAAIASMAGKQRPPPRTAADFTNACKELGSRPEALSTYVQGVDPASYPSLFKQSLDNACISHLLRALVTLVQADPGYVVEALHQLTKVNRFTMVAAMMSRADKAALQQLCATAEQAGVAPPEGWGELRRQYKV